MPIELKCIFVVTCKLGKISFTIAYFMNKQVLKDKENIDIADDRFLLLPTLVKIYVILILARG